MFNCNICQNEKITLKSIKKCKCRKCYRIKHPKKPILSQKNKGIRVNNRNKKCKSKKSRCKCKCKC